MENIYMIGFMGAGKSVISQNLQMRLGYELIDTDEYISHQEGASINDIFAEKGEEYFRNLETLLLENLVSKKHLIVSCGGGMVLRDKNISLMKKGGTVVLLTASAEVIFERVSRRQNRPLLKDKKSAEDISAMMEQRRPFYERAADITIPSDEYSPYATAAKVQRKLGLGNAPLSHSNI